MHSPCTKVSDTTPLPFSSVMYSCHQFYSRFSKLSLADCLSPFLFHFHIAGFLWSYSNFNLPSPPYLLMLAMVPYERESKLVSSPSPQPSPFWEVESTEERPRKKKNNKREAKEPQTLIPRYCCRSKQHYLQGFLRKAFEKTKICKCKGREAQAEERGEHCAVQPVPGRTLWGTAPERRLLARRGRSGDCRPLVLCSEDECCLLELLSLATI